ncbi:hypothetical protein BDN72DRAFT_800006, partial [Pluteus cervinus]
MDNSSEIFRLFDLPVEIIDDILGHLPLHRDLLNFALASRSSCSVVVPRHTEYRVVHFDEGDTDFTWTHLAQRTDLASNIREIHVIYEEAPEELDMGPWHRPEGLVGSNHNIAHKSKQQIREDMFRALWSMTRLEKLHWNWVPGRSAQIIPRMLHILRTIPTLKHLAFHHGNDFHMDSSIDKYPLWAIRGLESLSLQGSAWNTISQMKEGKRSMLGWLQGLSSLQFLKMDTRTFLRYSKDLSFPQLQRLNLEGDTSHYLHVVPFLRRHPAIEELSLLLLMKLGQLPTNFLPKLKRLCCEPSVLLQLEMAYSRYLPPLPPRRLEYLHLSGIPPRSDERSFFREFCDLKFLDRTTLRALSLGVSGSVSDFIDLAKTFPVIEELYIVCELYRGKGRGMELSTFADLLQIVPHFHNLKVIHGFSPW